MNFKKLYVPNRTVPNGTWIGGIEVAIRNLRLEGDEILRKKSREVEIIDDKLQILIDDMIAIHDIRIILGDNGLFVAMPSRKTPTGDYRDIVHPISQEARDIIEKAIVEEYNKAE